MSTPQSSISFAIEGKFDGDFFVLVDDEEKEYDETKTTDTYRTLSIGFFAGSEEIQIFGTSVIPEFGVLAIMILAISLVSIIAITSRSRLARL